MPSFKHPYPFDPAYGYGLPDLLNVKPPEAPADFADFWRRRYDAAIGRKVEPALAREKTKGDRWKQFDLSYISTGQTQIKGWALVPREHPIRRGIVCLHGYNGLDGPDLSLPFPDTVLFFPCLRGLSRSAMPFVPSDSSKHVLHLIRRRDDYIHGGCVEDVWMAVSALAELFPEIKDHIGLMGISFGGGVGMMSLPWDRRIRRAHFEVPSFGNQALRLQLPTVGSGAAVINWEKKNGGVLETLAYYDSATAASFVRVPAQIAAALFDPCVAPPGQFAIHNALPEDFRRLFVLDAGHFDYPNQAGQRRSLMKQIEDFFADL